MKNRLEHDLRKLGRALADDYQVARFFKVPEEMQATPCDFIGYTANGRTLMIEAKMVNRPRLPIGKKPGLLAHQWAEMSDAHRAGCIVLLVWEREGFVQILDMSEIARYMLNMKSISWQSTWLHRHDELCQLLMRKIVTSPQATLRPQPLWEQESVRRFQPNAVS